MLGQTGLKLHDLGPRRKTGTVQSGAIWTPEGLQSGPEDTASTYTNVGLLTALSSVSSLTCLTHVKPLAAPASWSKEDSIVSVWPSAFILRLDALSTGRIKMFIATTGDNSVATFTVGDISGQWHTIGGVWDGVNVRATYDGALGSPTARGNSTLTVTTNAYLGDTQHVAAGAESFDGIIGLVGIWNRALSEAEIREWSLDPWAMLRLDDRRVRSIPPIPKSAVHQECTGSTLTVSPHMTIEQRVYVGEGGGVGSKATIIVGDVTTLDFRTDITFLPDKWYELFVLPALDGVESGDALFRARFLTDGSGNPLPTVNLVSEVELTCLPAGDVKIEWEYIDQDATGTPTSFELRWDLDADGPFDASGAADATVNYVAGQTRYTYTVTGLTADRIRVNIQTKEASNGHLNADRRLFASPVVATGPALPGMSLTLLGVAS